MDYIFNMRINPTNTDNDPNPIDQYMAKNGLSFSTIKRVAKTITTMDGKEHRKYVDKNSISVSLFEVDNATKAMIEYYLFRVTPAVVTFEGAYDSYNGEYYVTGWSPKVKTVEGGIAYYDGLSFTLEEK